MRLGGLGGERMGDRRSVAYVRMLDRHFRDATSEAWACSSAQFVWRVDGRVDESRPAATASQVVRKRPTPLCKARLRERRHR